MVRYSLRRLGGILVTLFFLSMFTFVLSRAIPGGPWDVGVEIPIQNSEVFLKRNEENERQERGQGTVHGRMIAHKPS